MTQRLAIRLAALGLLFAAAPVAGESPSGLSWPEGQVLPHFSTPAKTLDAVDVSALPPDEQLTFSALAGQVNRTQPRVMLWYRRSEEGPDRWLRTSTVDLEVGKLYDESAKFDLIAKYRADVRGVVLYDAKTTPHVRNLACTVAGLRQALPVTRDVLAELKEHGVELPVLEDLTSLKLASEIEVYEHLYQTYWPECEKRFLVSARPEDRGGDFHHTRDLAAACGAAVVWLDCREPPQRELFGKFLAGMPAGNAVVLGWYTSERSGVTTATGYGIGTMPADHFMNATVFAGGSHEIRMPEAPPRPALENKLYVTVFVSDGDNIQYTQHALRRLWDQSSSVRGQAPINWTIAPGLVDIAPGILNYYYSTATPNDCFVCGPSGMGYTMPVNTLREPGAPLGSMLDDQSRMNAYTRLTSRYLERAGLRVVTVWDNLTPMQRQCYEANCPGLLGVTVQNFQDDPTVASSVVNDRLKFERLEIPYAGSADQLRRSIEEQLRRWQRDAPGFVAYQAEVWSRLRPDRLIPLMTAIEREHPEIEFVRGDHYFDLQRESRTSRTESSTAAGE